MKPVIIIPMGDPAGIGPEIAMKALNNKELYNICTPVVVGIKTVFDKIGRIINSSLAINVIKSTSDASSDFGQINLIEIDFNNDIDFAFGMVSSEAGKAAYLCIEKAVEIIKEGNASAMATTPINKESIKAAGIADIGHTEMLERLTESKDPLTMFQVFDLRVFFLSRHVSLEKACKMVTKERIELYSKRCIDALNQLGVDDPKLVIAGLNPHCGEHGLFGDEEDREIVPAVEQLKLEGFDVKGPSPADSVFYQALKGKYDAVLSLYHDQGHIATKMVDFERTISLTIGMPFLRTSVDHGTAFDIAGKGIAAAVSMEEAIRLAALYAPNYLRT
jgi:4-hydroxythreonine-4-phosphate dehydrogenase